MNILDKPVNKLTLKDYEYLDLLEFKKNFQQIYEQAYVSGWADGNEAPRVDGPDEFANAVSEDFAYYEPLLNKIKTDPGFIVKLIEKIKND